jgi:hypothetical protein
VRLARTCVQPGDMQTLIVQSRPGYVVAYNTTYSDGRHGNAYGGAGYSPVNSDGSYRSSWTVSSATPSGLATVAAGTQRGSAAPATMSVTFTVTAHC